MDPSRIPVLTEAVARPRRSATADGRAHRVLSESERAELQGRIFTGSVILVEKLLHQAYQEMEATLFDAVMGRLRQELPTVIDRVLNEHFEKFSKDE